MAGDASDERLTSNERLRRANDALRARMERQAPLGFDGGAVRGIDPTQSLARHRRVVEAALDASPSATLLFGEDRRLIAVNARFATLFADIAPRVRPGTLMADALRLIAASAAMALAGDAERAAWAKARIAAAEAGAPSSDLAPMTGGRWVELVQRRTLEDRLVLRFDDVTAAMRAGKREVTRRGADADAAARAALDQSPVGLAAFDADGRLAYSSHPFRALLGLSIAEAPEGGALSALAARATESLGPDAADKLRRLTGWSAQPPPRSLLTVDAATRAGAVLEVVGRDAGRDGGFTLSVADVSDERRAADEVARVRSTLEARVADRTVELVALNDRLVQEVAERRAIEAEMRAARDAAEAANLSKTRFLAAASHDLLQPLNAAKLFLSSLDEAPDLPPAARRTLRKVGSAFVSVETLLNALLDISKLDAGGGEARVCDVPVSRILGPLAEEFGPVAASRGLKLRVRPTKAVVRSDPQHLRRILQNLVSNALKYTLSGGVIVGCRRRGSALSIEVWDSGVGVPLDERRRIFEEFHRVDGGNPRSEQGMGLGLTIVDRAARLLGHRVSLRSVEGAGSVFSVIAPAGDAAAFQAGDDEAPMVAERFVSGREQGMIALVVDDDDDVREAIGALLARWGVDMLPAADLGGALDHLAGLGMAPDVLLLDYHLGDGPDGRPVSGLDALAALRAAGAAGAPVVVMTADRSRVVADEVRLAGARMLSKPVAPSRLRALLHWCRDGEAAATG